ncbi:MAG: hypothetical protein CL663_01480 [Bacteroidetes bacterium]|nr:hypothetical protein [Bacteroidota bacterium]
MESVRIQYIAIVGSALLLLFILYLIRQKRLKEEYSLLWLFFGVLFLAIALWKDLLNHIAEWIGIAYPPAALFLVLLMALFVIMIEFSVIISRHSRWIRKMGQEIGLMKTEIEELKKKESNDHKA